MGLGQADGEQATDRAGRGVRPARGTFASAVMAVCVLAGGAGLGACSLQRPTFYAPPSSPDDGLRVHGSVAVSGDSLTVGSMTNLPEDATTRGMNVKMVAKPGRRIRDGMADLKAILNGRDLVVVALGTNDTSDGLSPSDMAERIDEMMAMIGPTTPVVWLTVYRRDSAEGAEWADQFNTVLSEAPARHPNLSVADWWAYIIGHPDYIASDGIHLTPTGYAARTSWLIHQMATHLPRS